MTNTQPTRTLLNRLAEAQGVATEFWQSGYVHEVSTDVIIRILASMGIDASTDEKIYNLLDTHENEQWQKVMSECTVIRQGEETYISIFTYNLAKAQLEIVTEDESIITLTQADVSAATRVVDGEQRIRIPFIIPSDLPLGYHTLRARVTLPGSVAVQTHHAALICVPASIPTPKQKKTNGWGITTQLYAARSQNSWGIGDTSDLYELASLCSSLGGQFVCINPLNSSRLQKHVSASPYELSSRRFYNPIYIRLEDIREVSYMPSAQRSLIDWAGEQAKQSVHTNTPIDRTKIWEAKKGALEAIYKAGRSQGRERAFRFFVEQLGEELENFAFWCALLEAYPQGLPDSVSDPYSIGAQSERARLHERIDFFMWMQWIMDEQLEHVQRAAKDIGMGIGVIHTITAGVSPDSVDVWSDKTLYAHGVSMGSAPDVFAPSGRVWNMVPWNPRALRERAYQPLRNIIRSALKHAGGLRIDHILGFFRQWWIPVGMDSRQGTYVYFDHEATIGILLLEAYRADAIVIGEDIGDSQAWVIDYLRERGILGTSIVWYEQNDRGVFKKADEYPEDVMVMLATQHMAPASGRLMLEDIAKRHELSRDLSDAMTLEQATAVRDALLQRLYDDGFIQQSRTERDCVEGLYSFMGSTACQLKAVSLADAIGELRAQHIIGSEDRYPNWSLPLADGRGNVVLNDDLAANGKLMSLLSGFLKNSYDNN